MHVVIAAGTDDGYITQTGDTIQQYPATVSFRQCPRLEPVFLMIRPAVDSTVQICMKANCSRRLLRDDYLSRTTKLQHESKMHQGRRPSSS